MRTSIRLGVLASTAALAASLGAGAVAHADVSTTGVSGALSGETLAVTNSTDKALVCEAIIGEKAVVDVAYKSIATPGYQPSEMEYAVFMAALVTGAAVQVGGEVGAKSTALLVKNDARTPKGTEWAVGCGEGGSPQYAARSTGGSVPAGVLGSLGSAGPMAEGSLGQITALLGMMG